MKIKFFFNFKNIFFLFSFLIYSVPAASSDFYISCYYYDSNLGKNSKNPSLMRASTIYPGASSNYYWALDIETSQYTKLNGYIEDGFFIEQDLKYDDVVKKCNKAIHKGTFFWPSKKSFYLYDFKASRSNYDGYEYPIRFIKEDTNKSQIKQIILFGDSLSDTGNLKRWTKVMPYYPFWFGRFSDGFIWDDYLNYLTHIPIINFSYGGAKTEGSNNFYVKDYYDYILSAGRNIVTGSSKDYINNYVNNYLTTNSYQSKSYYISKPQDSLYMMWIGANDYISTFTNEKFTEDFFDYPDSVGGSNTISKRAVDNIIDQIIILHQRGAYHFFIMNLPDFGKTPLVMDMQYNKHNDDILDKEEFAKKISTVIKKYNEYLRISVTNLQKIMGNNIHIVYLDLSSNFDSLLAGKNIYSDTNFDYGFTALNSKYPINGDPNKFIQSYCYQGGYLNASKLVTKSDKKAYDFAYQNTCKTKDGSINKFAIFWNSPHPTSYTHCWLSYAIERKLEEENLIPNLNISMDNFKNYCAFNVNGK